jgi:hypothetical protein
MYYEVNITIPPLSPVQVCNLYHEQYMLQCDQAYIQYINLCVIVLGHTHGQARTNEQTDTLTGKVQSELLLYLTEHLRQVRPLRNVIYASVPHQRQQV